MTSAANPDPNLPARASPPAWTPDELRDPHASSAKHDKVRGMFGAIANRYDLVNRVHSLWFDQAWRRAAARLAEVGPTDEVLDVACGTGDLTHAFARRRPRRVVGVDFTPAMLDRARVKRERLPASLRGLVEYAPGDAQALGFPDASFDIVSIAFGIRNVAAPQRAAAEFFRVLRPAGRVVVLEFAEPRGRLARWLNAIYIKRLMPVTATLISGDTSGAYRYLPRSVETFLNPAQVRLLLESVGFRAVRQRTLAPGVCVCTVAAKP